MRRSLLIGGVLALLLLATGCEPVRPPVVGPTRRAPAIRYEPDRATSGLLVAGEGTSHVAIWSSSEATLQMDRFEGSTPVGAPLVLDRNEDPSALEMGWTNGSAAVGNGFVLASFEVGIGGAHGLDFRERTLFLVAPDGRRIALHGGPSTGLGYCSESTDGYGVARNEIAWNGSTFLVAMGCETSTRMFRVSTGGAISLAATLPPATSMALASAADHFLLVYAVPAGDYAPVDVRAQRLAPDGRAVGGPLALDRFRSHRSELIVAASNGAYLAAWTVPGEDGYPDLLSRTVRADGQVGGTRVLSGEPGPQTDPALIGGAEGSWFAAWTDPYGEYLDVYGTTVAADGTVRVEDGRPLASPPGHSSTEPALTRGPSGTAYLTSVRVGAGVRLGVTRKLDHRGAPSGSSFAATRAPVRQECRDVAGGRDRFLVIWHETSPDGDTDLVAQRYRPDGAREGPEIALSSAPGDQTCPTAAWNGSSWLVVWTDQRGGDPDVYGALVSGAGTVSPGAGFAISTTSSSKISPVVAAEGTRWVVAWTDRRNGNGDVYAARVAADRRVLDPEGIAVTTADGDQGLASVASTRGSTLVAWAGGNAFERRVLRHDGTFLGGVVRIGARATRWPGPTAAAGGNRLGVLFEHSSGYPFPLVLALVDPASGAGAGRTTVNGSRSETSLFHSDMTHDGRRFVFATNEEDEGEPGASGNVGTLSGGQVRMARAGPVFLGSAIAALPSGRSLLVSNAEYEPTVTVAPVVDAP